MAPSPFLRTLYASTFILISILPLHVRAQGSTGSGRIASGQCPPNVEDSMVYSPFKAYFHWPQFQGSVQKCWVAADCLFEAAGESRKQQFAATALVMGLIPLTLKDVAWPERRIIHVTKKLNPVVEVLVLALGLVPTETMNTQHTMKKSAENNVIAKMAWRLPRSILVLYIVICTLGTLGSYAGLAVMEIFSKRSALGCVYPVFVATWYVVALVPACIHAVFARRRRARYQRRLEVQGLATPVKEGYANARELSEEDRERKKKIISAVQGADEDWPVQLSWGVYYISGTLIFTSIMAVTVVELVVWVALGFAVTGTSKLLAFFLCLVFEKTGRDIGI